MATKKTKKPAAKKLAAAAVLIAQPANEAWQGDSLCDEIADLDDAFDEALWAFQKKPPEVCKAIREVAMLQRKRDEAVRNLNEQIKKHRATIEPWMDRRRRAVAVVKQQAETTPTNPVAAKKAAPKKPAAAKAGPKSPAKTKSAKKPAAAKSKSRSVGQSHTKASTNGEAAYTKHYNGDGAECCVCGCTAEKACPGGCSWVEHPTDDNKSLCSRCLPSVTPPAAATTPKAPKSALAPVNRIGDLGDRVPEVRPDNAAESLAILARNERNLLRAAVAVWPFDASKAELLEAADYQANGKVSRAWTNLSDEKLIVESKGRIRATGKYEIPEEAPKAGKAAAL